MTSGEAAATIILPVKLKTMEFTESTVILVECPECFATVRDSRLNAHLKKCSGGD